MGLIWCFSVLWTKVLLDSRRFFYTFILFPHLSLEIIQILIRLHLYTNMCRFAFLLSFAVWHINRWSIMSRLRLYQHEIIIHAKINITPLPINKDAHIILLRRFIHHSQIPLLAFHLLNFFWNSFSCYFLLFI
jgi:hypothetical protein